MLSFITLADVSSKSISSVQQTLRALSRACSFCQGAAGRPPTAPRSKTVMACAWPSVGIVCVAGEYRVMDEAPWPAQIQDVKATIRWMRANSESLGIDPAAIVVGGKSAGGHLALLAAGTRGLDAFEGNSGHTSVSSEVAGVIGVAPVADLTEWARRPTMAKLFGENPAAEIVKAASPIAHVNGDYPPTLLVHGTADTRVPHAMTMRMYQALEQAGVPVDLYLYAGQDHFFDQEAQFCDAIADAMAFFIARYVPVQQPVTTA